VSEVIRIKLTADQVAQLAPLVLDAARSSHNVIFVSTVSPNRSDEDDTAGWQLQSVIIPATLGGRVKKLILAGGKK
jgi:predicted metal-dependent HD superfamily phosphohydrolase